MKTVIIEVSGGVVQDVYSDVPGARIFLVNWDEGDSLGDESGGGPMLVQSLEDLPSSTRHAVAKLVG